MKELLKDQNEIIEEIYQGCGKHILQEVSN